MGMFLERNGSLIVLVLAVGFFPWFIMGLGDGLSEYDVARYRCKETLRMERRKDILAVPYVVGCYLGEWLYQPVGE